MIRPAPVTGDGSGFPVSSAGRSFLPNFTILIQTAAAAGRHRRPPRPDALLRLSAIRENRHCTGPAREAARGRVSAVMSSPVGLRVSPRHFSAQSPCLKTDSLS